jgi:hypothetical protein
MGITFPHLFSRREREREREREMEMERREILREISDTFLLCRGIPGNTSLNEPVSSVLVSSRESGRERDVLI